MSKKPNGKHLNKHECCKIISSGQPQGHMQKNFKTYAKWRLTTCLTNKSWTLFFFAKKCVFNRDAYLSGRLLYTIHVNIYKFMKGILIWQLSYYVQIYYTIYIHSYVHVCMSFKIYNIWTCMVVLLGIWASTFHNEWN